MKEEHFKRAIYIILGILILLFYTKDIPLFSNDFYNKIYLIEHPDDVLVLVNKNNKLPAAYRPRDLEAISLEFANEEKYLRKDAKEQFEKLSKEAKTLGYSIVAVSAYRGYDYQEELYHYYVKTKGEKYADLCSARPGHSEHQTGLALDVMGSNNDYDEFEYSVEFSWMKENAHRYGFILRYPEGKENVTGFKYEPWHYRYVGIDIAKYIYENNLTLEEYKQDICEETN